MATFNIGRLQEKGNEKKWLDRIWPCLRKEEIGDMPGMGVGSGWLGCVLVPTFKVLSSSDYKIQVRVGGWEQIMKNEYLMFNLPQRKEMTWKTTFAERK